MKKENNLDEFFKSLYEGKVHLKFNEIDEYFCRWIKPDSNKKNFYNQDEIIRHIAQQEFKINNNINYIQLLSNSAGMYSILGKLFKKYKVRYKSFYTGKKEYDGDLGQMIEITRKKYAVILK